MKKILLFLLIIVAISVNLIGLIFKPFTEVKPKVVVVLKDLNTQYWNIVKAGAEKGFQNFGIDGKVVAPSFKSSKDTQDYMLENILKEKPDVLIVSPEESSIPILDKFNKNNIPVLLIDTDVPWGNKTSFIGTNNFDLGIKAGELLASGLQPGDKVAFTISDSELIHPVFRERIKGAKLSLEAAGIKIVKEKVKPNDSSPVKKAMETILKKHPDIKGVYQTTDISALSALKVIEEQGLKLPVLGADGITKMVESIGEGTLNSTIAQNPYDMGYKSVETAWKVIRGEKVSKNINTGVDIITIDNAKIKLDFLNNLLR